MLGHRVLLGKMLLNTPSPKKVQKVVVEHGTIGECGLPSGIPMSPKDNWQWLIGTLFLLLFS